MPTLLEARNSVPVLPLAVPRPGTPTHVPTPSTVSSPPPILPFSQSLTQFLHRSLTPTQMLNGLLVQDPDRLCGRAPSRKVIDIPRLLRDLMS